MPRFESVGTGSWFTMEVNSNLHPLRTSTTPLEAWIIARMLPGGRLDLAAPVTGKLVIDVEDLKTDSDLYDLEMRNLLDPQRYPTIEGGIVSMHELDKAGRYHVVGNVTFHGTTRQVEGDVTLTISPNNDRFIEIKGEQTFDMRDFGVSPPSIFFLKVYPDIRVTIEILAQRVD